MKRYKINKAVRVNKGMSKTGLKWQYNGKTDDWKSVVDDFNKYSFVDGIRITDTETNEVVYEQIR